MKWLRGNYIRETLFVVRKLDVEVIQSRFEQLIFSLFSHFDRAWTWIRSFFWILIKSHSIEMRKQRLFFSVHWTLVTIRMKFQCIYKINFIPQYTYKLIKNNGMAFISTVRGCPFSNVLTVHFHDYSMH